MAEGGLVTQALEIDDWSGGKTDNYISCSPNQFQDADNMLLVKIGNKAKPITRPGLIIYNPDLPRIPAFNRLSGIAEVEDTIFQMSGRQIFYYGDTEWKEVLGPTDNWALANGNEFNFNAWDVWNKHLLVTNDALSFPVKVYDNGTDWTCRQLGLPMFEIDPETFTITPANGATNLRYLYKFMYVDEYTTNGVTYREVGPTNQILIDGPGLPVSSTNPVSISGIPVLENGENDNYNTSGIKIEIYRTLNGGTASYKVGEILNGVTSFSDTTGDGQLTSGIQIYTDAGTLDFDQAPACKYLLIANNTAFYLGVVEDGVFYPRKIRQAVPGAPYAAPFDLYDETEDDITGGGTVGIYPIVFTKGKTYRLEGVFDEFGNGGFQLRLISNSIGCISHRSVITTRDGIYFASEQGFCFTNGFDVRVISEEFPVSYKELLATPTMASRIYGAYDSEENRVWWAGQRSSISTDCDIIFIGHLKAPNIPFTTMSGGVLSDNFSPTSLLFVDGEMLMGDRRGYLLKFDINSNTDPLIDIATEPTSWNRAAIIYDHRGPAFDFGTSMIRKWVPRVVVNADNVSNLSLSVEVNNDNGGIFHKLSSITSKDNAAWGSDSLLWGNPDIRWNYAAVIAHWRRMPSPVRCMYKQVRLTNAYDVIDSSDILGLATTDADLKTVTLENPILTFSSESVNYAISFDRDNYTAEWIVTIVNGNEITVDDPDGTFLSLSGRQWKLRGYAKGEVLSLISYVLAWAPLTMTQSTYKDT